MGKASLRVGVPGDAKEARQLAITRFGHKPTAAQVLQAHLISSPGTQYREWIHPDVILEAAKIALVEIPPVPRTLDVTDHRIAGLLASLSVTDDGFANHCIWKGELASLLLELQRYRAAAALKSSESV